MVECLVEYEYEAQEEDELTLRVGDVITEVVQQDGGWWEGKLNGRRGAFPDNFVKVMDKETVKKPSLGAAKREQKSRVASISDRLGEKGGIRMGPPPPGLGVIKKGPFKKNCAKVLHSYSPEADDELALEVGDIVEILKQEEEGWWEGRLHGKVGMLPSNFVEMMEVTDEAEESSHQADQERDLKAAAAAEPMSPRASTTGPKAVNRKPTGGVGLGNIFSDGPVKLRHKGSNDMKKTDEKSAKDDEINKISEHKKKLPVKDPVKEPQSPIEVESRKPAKRAKALYSYVAENEDELTLNEGDIITVTDQELEDSGWWQGELNGKVGVFPDNFVELLPEERPKKPPPPTVPHPAASSSKAVPGRVERPPPPDPVKITTDKPDKPAPPEPARIKKVTEEKTAPPLQAKKTAVPPPVSRKPVRTPEQNKSSSQTDDDKVKEKEPDDFDSIEATEKLSHPKRPKGPAKRPPSQLIKDQRELDEEQSNVEESKPSQHTNNISEKPQIQSREIKDTPLSSAAVDSSRLSRSIVPKAEGHATDVPPRPQRPDLPDMGELASLKREMQHLRESTVSKDVCVELKQEVASLKESLNGLKVHFNKRLMELMNEVDEEKKIRLAMQVEMDRVKKLAMSS